MSGKPKRRKGKELRRKALCLRCRREMEQTTERITRERDWRISTHYCPDCKIAVRYYEELVP